MATRMLTFVDVEREMPDKRDAGARRRDFQEIYGEFAAQRAAEQASRCSQCGVPFCQVHCPLQNNIPDWLMLTASGRLEEAYEIAQATNNFPEICGRICPQDRLCEGNCVIEQSGHGTVTIGARSRNTSPTRPSSRRLGRADPAPLAERDREGRHHRRRAGRAGRRRPSCGGWDSRPRSMIATTAIGGLLTYGIPGFKLEKGGGDAPSTPSSIARAGVKFRPRLRGRPRRDLVCRDSVPNHDAVLIATGVYRSPRPQGRAGLRGGRDLSRRSEYLTASNRKGFGDSACPPSTDGEPGRDRQATSSSSAVATRRWTACGPPCARGRPRSNASTDATAKTCRARLREVTNAEEEGVEFDWLTAPQGLHRETPVVTRA